MEIDHLENLEKMGGQYEMSLKEILWNGVNCTNEDQDKNKRIKRFKFYKLQEFSWPHEELASKENSVPWNKLTCELSTLFVECYYKINIGGGIKRDG